MADQEDWAGQDDNVIELRRRDSGCDKVEPWLEIWAADGLEGAEAAAVATHVEGCARCTAEVQAIREILAALHMPVPDVDDAQWARMAAEIQAAIELPLAEVVPMRAHRRPSSSGLVPATRKWWRGSAIASAGLAAAAALLLTVVGRHPEEPAARNVVSTEKLGDLFDVPMLQVDEMLGATDSDPLETVDDLDDLELEVVDTVLDEGGA